MEKVRCPYCHDLIDSTEYPAHEAGHLKPRPDGQQGEYATLPPEEREAGPLDGVPRVYRHAACGTATRMPEEIIRSYLTDPSLYSSDETFCCGCGTHVPDRECYWVETGEGLKAYMDRLRASRMAQEAGVRPSHPHPGGRAWAALSIQTDPDPATKQIRLPEEAGEGPREFLVTASHAKSGREYPPFIVRAMDEAAARKMCQRGYLSLQSVERYVEREGAEKPRYLQYGPPISDVDFERDYGSRPADSPPSPGPAPYLLGCLGWFFLGPIGYLAGWWAGSSGEERRRDG